MSVVLLVPQTDGRTDGNLASVISLDRHVSVSVVLLVPLSLTELKRVECGFLSRIRPTIDCDQCKISIYFDNDCFSPCFCDFPEWMTNLNCPIHTHTSLYLSLSSFPSVRNHIISFSSFSARIKHSVCLRCLTHGSQTSLNCSMHIYRCLALRIL